MAASYGARGSECTATLSGGKFCSAPAHDGLPFPLCIRHAIQVHLAMLGQIRTRMGADGLEAVALSELRQAQTEESRRRAVSQVYYIDMPGDVIKIGYTGNITERCTGLRVSRDRVMATEPGGRQEEARRHRQFAAERIGKREDFDKSPRLLEHIKRIRERHGAPIITNYK